MYLTFSNSNTKSAIPRKKAFAPRDDTYSRSIASSHPLGNIRSCYPRTRGHLNKLEASRMEMQKVDQVSFDLFADQPDIYTYDSIALLFNTFTNPHSLRTGKAVNWSTGAEEPSNIGSLRCLGLS
ncbi:unnamed protein product, partial [Clonostachys chloroleuca]